MTSRVLQCTLLFCAFLFGCVAGQIPGVEINRQLGVGDLFRAAVTILVAYILGITFHRNFSEARAEKDLLLAQVKEIDVAMKATRTLFLSACFGGKSEKLEREILSSLRNVSSSLSILEKATAECLVANQSPALTKARSCYRECRSLLTDCFLATETPYTDETYTRAESAFAEFRDSLFRFSLAVNRHKNSSIF